ncbi:hypothetical protein MES4922_30370 [Mesorhizobium ventifaucium]|uniref:Uncharacterized protein n=1 Tax=Mesorhizobium ventifaucium TaxID=666020 RepID=A0ABM9DYV7_9HYPH|nr:hypothetical protein MES4922_30370 [Mesorhizobium ventifaucium]
MRAAVGTGSRHPDEIRIGRVIGDERLGDVLLGVEFVAIQSGNGFAEGSAGGGRWLECGVQWHCRLRRCRQRREVDAHERIALVGVIGRAADTRGSGRRCIWLVFRPLPRRRRGEITLRHMPDTTAEKPLEKPLRVCLRHAEGQHCRDRRKGHHGCFVSEEFHGITRSGCTGSRSASLDGLAHRIMDVGRDYTDSY